MLNKIIVAIDSYKGSLTSIEAVKCCSSAIREVIPGCNILEMPMSDGGEGFAELAANSPDYLPVNITVKGPLHHSVNAKYYLSPNKHTAVIEMAQACGLFLIDEKDRNPKQASSFGLGQMILHAVKNGATKIILGIGGSATNDGGMGMLCALGYKFYDVNNKALHGNGENLIKIKYLSAECVHPLLMKTSFIVAADVKNPFYGALGATSIFGSQKGASPDIIAELEKGMKHFARIISDYIYQNYTATTMSNCSSPAVIQKYYFEQEGAGAAGGVGGTISAMFNGTLLSGIDVILDIYNFTNELHNTDLIITGEGKCDCQTAYGKTAYGILQKAKKYNVPTIAICGQLDNLDNIDQLGFLSTYSILTHPSSITECMDSENTQKNLYFTTREIIKTIYHLNINPLSNTLNK